MSTSRLFIAVELDSGLKTQLRHVQDHLKKSGADVRWVNPENIHLTLKFLGDTPNDKITSVAEVLNETACRFAAFECGINHLGAFPKPENPQIIWIGIEEHQEELKKIVDTLEEKLEKIGFKKEVRAFAAHITLGRLRSAANRPPLSKEICAYTLPGPYGQRIKELALFRSTLTARGPVYEILSKAYLKQD